MRKPSAGQSTVELAVMLGAVVAALVATHVFVRRAYQGYLYANASAHGPQTDPNGANSMTQSMNEFSQHQTVEIKTTEPGVDLPGGDKRLPSIPGGHLPGRTLQTNIRVETTWDVSREAQHETR